MASKLRTVVNGNQDTINKPDSAFAIKSNSITRLRTENNDGLSNKGTEKLVAFTKRIGPEATAAYSEAFDIVKGSDIITEDKVLTFVSKLDAETAWAFFAVMASIEDAKTLTNDKIVCDRILKFCEDVGPKVSWAYFSAVKTTHFIDALTNDNVLEFARRIDTHQAYDYFRSINVGMDEKAITDSIRYYTLLPMSPKKTGEQTKVEFVQDANFLNAAVTHIGQESAISEVYNFASAAYTIKKEGLMDFNFNELFAQGRNNIARYFYERTRPLFDKLNIDANNLDVSECITLMRNLDYTRNNIDNLRSFIEQRKSNLKQRSPFNNSAMLTGIVAERYLSERTSIDINQKSALETIVYVLNGSRENDKVENAKKLLLDSGYVDTDTINSASGRWANIKGSYQYRLGSEFRIFQRNPTVDNAKTILDVFKNATKERQGEMRNPVLDFIDRLEPLVTGEKATLSGGARIVAYLTDKDNMLSITSNNSGACCFIGGFYSDAGLPYALDNGIVLINFGITDSDIKQESLKSTKVYGIAICSFAKMDKTQPVLFVDSFESGVTLNNALSNDYTIVVEALKKVGRSTGCSAIAVSTKPRNPISRKFADFISGQKEQHKFSFDIKKRLWIEVLDNEYTEVKLLPL